MRKTNLRIRIAGNELLVKVYLTKVAGLVVHQGLEWNHFKGKAILKRRSWNITQYPSGLAAFQEIPTRAVAVEIAENDMGHLNWVGFTGVDAVAANDKADVNAMVALVRLKIANLQTPKRYKK